jgi:hypothetical protein
MLPRAYCFAIAIIGHHRYRAESIRTGSDLERSEGAMSHNLL